MSSPKHADQVFWWNTVRHAIEFLCLILAWERKEPQFKERLVRSSEQRVNKCHLFKFFWIIGKSHCDQLGSFSAEAVWWRPTRSSSNRTRTEMEWDSAGTFGPPAVWKPLGWWSQSPASSHHSKRDLICHQSNMNQFCAAGLTARQCSTHYGE